MKQQWPGKALKTGTSPAPVSIPSQPAIELSGAMQHWRTDYLITDGYGRRGSPWAVERAVRTAARNWMACPMGSGSTTFGTTWSRLIASEAVKVVQSRMRQASAKTTLDAYAHLWPVRTRQTS